MIWLVVIGAVLLWLAVLVFMVSLCVAAARADERIKQMHWRAGG